MYKLDTVLLFWWLKYISLNILINILISDIQITNDNDNDNDEC